MAYALIALMDEGAEERIKELWQGLERLGLSAYASERPGIRPHLTLAAFEEISDPDMLYQVLDKLCQEKGTSCRLDLSSLGTFIGSQVLYLSPKVTEELLEFHRTCHHLLENQVTGLSQLYQPSQWFPHLTLVNYLSTEKWQASFAYCQEYLRRLEADLVGLAVIAISPERSVQTLYQSYFEHKGVSNVSH